jgi:hypothetical protein
MEIKKLLLRMVVGGEEHGLKEMDLKKNVGQ